MGKKWILGLIALAAAGSTAFAASSVLGGESSAPDRPEYATVEIRATAHGPFAERRASENKGKRKPKSKKPRMIYLQGQTTTVDVAQTGANIDIGLLKCPDNSRVIDGGVFSADTNVFQQGSYVPNRKEYHVLLGFPGGTAQNFTLTSHLICLKGVR